MSDPGSEMIEVWRQPDGFWRWRYRNPDGTDLLSNEGYEDRVAAVEAASTAYPTVPDVQVHKPRRHIGGWLKRLALIAVIVWLARKLLGVLRVVSKIRKLLRVFRSDA